MTPAWTLLLPGNDSHYQASRVLICGFAFAQRRDIFFSPDWWAVTSISCRRFISGDADDSPIATMEYRLRRRGCNIRRLGGVTRRTLTTTHLPALRIISHYFSSLPHSFLPVTLCTCHASLTCCFTGEPLIYHCTTPERRQRRPLHHLCHHLRA